MPYQLESLPFANESELETRPVLKKAASAHRYLAELKGVAAAIPNENILINMLTLQEAKDSSAVENIITTHDELFKAELFTNHLLNPAAKEVQDYAAALKIGFEKVKREKLIRLNEIIEIQSLLEKNNAGLRKLPGTTLKNLQTGEVVYVPPQNADEINRLMDNLVSYINDELLSDLDGLIKMAIIHHQFESIHPFYDGNGRAGRIINILYLVMNELLDLPILYLSRFIIKNKSDYYTNLQAVRDTGDWQPWLLYILNGIEQISIETIQLIKSIKDLMMKYKHNIRKKLPKLYSQGLINNLFKHPYTRIEFMVKDLRVSRITATKYLDQLTEAGYLCKERIGRNNYYINRPLYNLFIERNT